MKRIVSLITTLVLATSLVAPAYAAEQNLEFYSLNNIYWYSSTEMTNSCFIGSGEGNTDYAGNQIFNDAQLSKIQQNQVFYEKAQDETGIPWQMLAVIHIREHSALRHGPANRQGPYQDFAKNPPEGVRAADGNGWKEGEYTDAEFQIATNWAANFIRGKAGNKADTLLSDQEAVKYTFFGYNGRAKVYVDQAKALGYTDEQAANGEGSPYVMNRADEQRDPTVNTTTWGQIKVDGGAIEYPANKDHGAYVMYASLAGIGTCYGGTTDPAAALKFLEKYITDTNEKYGKNFPLPTIAEFGTMQGTPGDLEPHPSSSANCWGAWDCGECTALSGWFVTQMTEYTYNSGNGINVVSYLMSHSDNIALGLTSGSEPRPLSVFSEKSSSDAGHTGVVLGVMEDGKLVTIENNYGHHTLIIRLRDPSNGMTFAYVGDKMKSQVGL